jgi:hypothetical protein
MHIVLHTVFLLIFESLYVGSYIIFCIFVVYCIFVMCTQPIYR